MTEKKERNPAGFPDQITEKIGILLRRETEARILIPVIRDLSRAFGREAVIQSISETIVRIAEDQGRDLAVQMNNSAAAFKEALRYWTRDNALEMEIRAFTPVCLAFDVTRCRYAEMYAALGAADLGAVFSCNRDGALIKGFNPGARMTRESTIMAGDRVCRFVYTFPDPPAGETL